MTASEVTDALGTRPATSRRNQSPSLIGQSLSLSLVSQQSRARKAVEQSIMQKFEHAYGAHLTHFLPDLLRLEVAGKLGAVAGIRTAHNETLFLEQYLDRPVEQAVASAFMTPVDRSAIVEIGNLVAHVPGVAYILFAVLATTLNDAGYRWVVCTATPQVASMLKSMGFSSQAICRADPFLLEKDAATWGEYYASRPSVIAGDVQLAAAQIASKPEIAGQLEQLRRPIAKLSRRLQAAHQ